MSKDDKSQVTREVGERVDVVCGLDPTTVKDLGDGVFEATVTTSEVDRSNENILTAGIDTSTWEKTGMPVLYGHDYSGLPIGKGLSFKTFKNKMTSRFQLAVQEYPFAKTVAALIKGGYLNSVSIGGVVKEWTEDYKTIAKMEMVEFSVVPVPANASAVITARSIEEVTGKSVNTIKKEFESFRQDVILDKLSGMPQNNAIDAIRVLKDLIVRLEGTLETSLTDANSKKHIRNIVIGDAKALATQSEKIIKSVKLIV